MALLREFRQFLMRGNVVDLAVAVVIGTAFGALVTALVRDILTPIIALIFGKHDFATLTFTINGSTFRYGDFINFLIAFVSVAAAVFFFVVKPINVFMSKRAGRPDPEAGTRPCSECLSEIPQAARRCSFCGSPQEPLTSAAPAPA
jgi:large conductance mechanosensitive channel